MNQENRNLIIAVILSIGIFLGFNYFFEDVSPQPIQKTTQKASESTDSSSESLADMRPKPQIIPESLAVSREKLIESRPRVEIKTPYLQGSIDPRGSSITLQLIRKVPRLFYSHLKARKIFIMQTLDGFLL